MMIMRTTLTIDDDILTAAKGVARARAVPVGKVLSDWARRGLQSARRIDENGPAGLPVFRVSRDSRMITIDDVRKLEDEA